MKNRWSLMWLVLAFALLLPLLAACGGGDEEERKIAQSGQADAATSQVPATQKTTVVKSTKLKTCPREATQALQKYLSAMRDQDFPALWGLSSSMTTKHHTGPDDALFLTQLKNVKPQNWKVLAGNLKAKGHCYVKLSWEGTFQLYSDSPAKSFGGELMFHLRREDAAGDWAPDEATKGFWRIASRGKVDKAFFTGQNIQAGQMKPSVQKSKPETKVPPEQVDRVFKYEREHILLAFKVDKVMYHFEDIIKSYESGRITEQQFYNYLIGCRDACEKAVKEFKKPPINYAEGMPKKLSEWFDKTTELFIEAYWARARALHCLLDYLNNQKPGDLNAYVEYAKKFGNLINLAMTSMAATLNYVSMPNLGEIWASPEYKKWAEFETKFWAISKQGQEKFKDYDQRTKWTKPRFSALIKEYYGTRNKYNEVDMLALKQRWPWAREYENIFQPSN